MTSAGRWLLRAWQITMVALAVVCVALALLVHGGRAAGELIVIGLVAAIVGVAITLSVRAQRTIDVDDADRQRASAAWQAESARRFPGGRTS